VTRNIWRAGEQQIDFVAPDIYFNLKEWTGKYVHSGSPLFLREASGGIEGAANAFYAIGHYDAISFSPSAVENCAGEDNPLAGSFDMLSQLAARAPDHTERIGGSVPVIGIQQSGHMGIPERDARSGFRPTK